MKYKYLLFDLDGTVSESAEGIRASLEYAINTLGAPMPDLSDYTRYVGPPLIDTFLNLVGLDPGTAERGAQLYRDYYNEKGKYLNRVYKGIPELLGRLREEDVKMCICSSKYELFAEEIIGILGLGGDFDAVCGSNIDGSRKDKKELIPYADRERTVMLGDTWYDAKGAKLCGVDFIGVRYGYGEISDMEEQGAKLFADTPGELFELLK